MGTSGERKKILFIVQLPPPVHGASIMNNYVVNSSKIKSRFNAVVLNLQFLTSIQDITRFSVRKVFKATLRTSQYKFCPALPTELS